MRNRSRILLISTTALLLTIASLGWLHMRAAAEAEVKSNPADDPLESALYARTDFFGTKVLVPYPTLEARNRINAAINDHQQDGRFFERLAQLEERLGN